MWYLKPWEFATVENIERGSNKQTQEQAPRKSNLQPTFMGRMGVKVKKGNKWKMPKEEEEPGECV